MKKLCTLRRYLISLRIARAGKPHTIGDNLVLPAIKGTVEVMFGEIVNFTIFTLLLQFLILNNTHLTMHCTERSTGILVGRYLYIVIVIFLRFKVVFFYGVTKDDEFVTKIRIYLIKVNLVDSVSNKLLQQSPGQTIDPLVIR